jgi:3-oxoacyl-[acyl-carrier protein] reductase
MKREDSKNDLRGRIALVTNAALGVGRATALALAEAGAAVIINYRHRKDDALATVAEITAMGGTAIAIGADVSKSHSIDTLMAQIRKHFGRVDLLVNNPLITPPADGGDPSQVMVDQDATANLKAAFLCMQAVMPGMRERGWGRIVNVCPPGMHDVVLDSDDVAAKAGIAELTRAYGAQLIKQGITVNAIAPSLLTTDTQAKLAGDLTGPIPLARLGTPQEVAEAVVMVLGNAYLTGQVIYAFGIGGEPAVPNRRAGERLHVN